ncbi:CBS domain-containing protein [Kibdelosporangium lantanae]|uniref:CBS domain-containing protein n=1 Tax=Kibdelosporangium lantanae TaxID=1497396 RepID=A0ABW3M6Q7_9PSEU
MRTLKVQDVMTRDVITVHEATPFKEVASTLVNHRVSGMPVTTPIGMVVGVVSESDLLPNESRSEHGRLYDVTHRTEARKAEARTARQLMTAPAVTVTPDTPVRQAAAILARRGINRLPVVDELGLLVGVVSRRDVLGMFLQSDEDILDEIQHEVFLRGMSVDPAQLDITVTDGVVTVRGQLELRSSIEIAEELVRGVVGVVDVVSQMTYAHDDQHLRVVDSVNGVQMRDLW